MQQSKILKERKQSLNKLPQQRPSILASCADSNKNRISSIGKRAIELTHKPQAKQEYGHYLIGWGAIPFFKSLQPGLQTINKNISNYSIGEKHIIFVNTQNEAFGIGDNALNQLGTKTSNSKQTIIPIIQKQEIKQVFCTQFGSFLQTKQHKLYGCGLNNRGQIGSGHNNQLSTFILIQKLSSFDETQGVRRKNSKSHINYKNSYSPDQKIITTQSYEITQEYNPNQIKTLLHSKEHIIDIVGGPFHTIALSSQGRIFHCGNLYTAQSILHDQFSVQFIQLNTTYISPIMKIKSGLTCFAFITSDSNLYLMGQCNQTLIYQEPYLIDKKCIDFAIQDKGMYLVDHQGCLHFYQFNSNKLVGKPIKFNKKIKEIHCGLDYVVFITVGNQIYGFGDNSKHQISLSSSQFFANPIELQFISNKTAISSLKCANNYIICLLDNACQSQNAVNSIERKSDNNKIKELERENKMLKQLLNSKTTRRSTQTQTLPQSKFNASRTIPNTRIFQSSLQIPFSQLTIIQPLSEGGYGVIYKALWRKTLVAVKLFKIDEGNEQSIRDFMSECQAMENMRHPHIVQFLGACTKGPQFAIVLQLCEGGTLWSLLQKSGGGQITWEERVRLAAETAKAMNYLHLRKTPILHRDLKSLNILLDSSRRVKLADFGWTKCLQNYMTAKVGTYQWMAPQVISSQQYTQKADIFSFGIILWQIASREAPYRNIPGAQVAQDVVQKDLRPTIPKKTPQPFAILIRKCWDKNPILRPTFNQIINQLEGMSFSS